MTTTTIVIGLTVITITATTDKTVMITFTVKIIKIKKCKS